MYMRMRRCWACGDSSVVSAAKSCGNCDYPVNGSWIMEDDKEGWLVWKDFYSGSGEARGCEGMEERREGWERENRAVKRVRVGEYVKVGE